MKAKILCAALAVIVFALLYINTGFLQAEAIDAKDLERWNFSNGVIVGADAFTLEGSSGECWVMVHGYTSTPDELRIVANAINARFNDTVYVPRLDGHGMRSSDITRYTVDHWYRQVEDIARRNDCRYLLGSSMGSLLALRYAETHDINGVVAVGAPFVIEPRYLPTGLVTGIAAPLVGYTKRHEIGETIDDKSARKDHISGFSFPLAPIVDVVLLSDQVGRDMSRINASVLFLHAQNDTVAHISGARTAFDGVKSRKSFVVLMGDHVVFRDYDKIRAVEEVLAFRIGS